MRQTSTFTFAVAVVLVSLLGCNSDLSQHAPQLVVLNAEEYRQQITDIDRLLFSTKPYDDARHVQLADKLEGLASRITTGTDAPFLKMEASEIRTLAVLAKNTRDNAPRDHLQEN